MSPLAYIVKTGAATLAEISALARTDKPAAEKLKQWAVEEMNVMGVEQDAPKA